MAERRMFAKSIVTSDAFLDMPMSARCLYFTLGMFADDDGFVNNPKSIIRQIGASVDDMNVLLAKRFVLSFDSGVIVIKHWRINNYLRNDRYHETNYVEEKERLSIDENGAYTEDGIPLVDQRYTEDSIGKVSIGKVSIDNNIKHIKDIPDRKKIPPTVEMVREYCKERGNDIDAEHFCDFYESKGWMVGKDKMKDWQASVRTWERQSGQPRVDKALIEEGRKAQEEAERKMEEDHKAEVERYKKEHPEQWADMEEKAKALTLEDVIKKAVG